jgi:hypothetical protein
MIVVSERADEKAHPRPPPKKQRDALMIGLPMAWAIIIMGYLATIVEPMFAGFALFMVIANYGFCTDYTLGAYYATMGSGTGTMFTLACLFSGIVNGLFTLFTWIIVKIGYVRVIFSLALVLSIATFVLSMISLPLGQIYTSMAQRAPEWFTEGSNIIHDEWKNGAFRKHQILEIVRAILFLGQGSLFCYGQHLTRAEFARILAIDY